MTEEAKCSVHRYLILKEDREEISWEYQVHFLGYFWRKMFDETWCLNVDWVCDD